MKKILLIFLAMAAILLPACGNEKRTVKSIEDLHNSDAVIGVCVGTEAMVRAEETIPEAKKSPFTDIVTGMEALKQGKIDAFVYEKEQMEFSLANGLLGVKLLDETIGEPIEIVAGISRVTEVLGLRESFNSFLETIKKDGTLDDMYYRWITSARNDMPKIEKPKAPDHKLVVATTGEVQPYSYYEGQKLTGFDIEMIYRFALYSNAEVEIKIYDFGGITAAAEGGAVDMILSNLNATKERREVLDFSDTIIEHFACAMVRDDAPAQSYTTLEEIKGKRIGVISGSNHDAIAQKALGNDTELLYYESESDLVTAVKANKIDAFISDQPLAQMAMKENPELVFIEEPLIPDSYGIAFPKGSPLREKADSALAKLKADGEIDRIIEKWINGDGNIELPKQTWPGKNGTYTVYSQFSAIPFTSVDSNGQPTGLDIEIILKIAQINDWKLNLVSADLTGCFTAVESGKTDIMIGAISITKERKNKVDFSEPYYNGAVRAVVLGNTDGNENISFWGKIANSFRKTFIIEDRWKMILSGLIVTLIISVFSGILGLLVGFGLCMLMRSKLKVTVKITKGFVRVIQGMPIVVFLMILFYVIFSKVDISGIIVAIIGFSINFGAYVSIMMKTGIDSVSTGQREAAEALGYGRRQTFFKVIFPQAAQNFIPIVKGEFISMVKMTSVVGFIAVQDLTKVSDIIRARTMEAFFTLVVTAVIYFILANLLTMLLTVVEKHTNSRQKPRKIKGVKEL